MSKEQHHFLRLPRRLPNGKVDWEYVRVDVNSLTKESLTKFFTYIHDKGQHRYFPANGVGLHLWETPNTSELKNTATDIFEQCAGILNSDEDGQRIFQEVFGEIQGPLKAMIDQVAVGHFQEAGQSLNEILYQLMSVTTQIHKELGELKEKVKDLSSRSEVAEELLEMVSEETKDQGMAPEAETLYLKWGLAAEEIAKILPAVTGGKKAVEEKIFAVSIQKTKIDNALDALNPWIQERLQKLEGLVSRIVLPDVPKSEAKQLLEEAERCIKELEAYESTAMANSKILDATCSEARRDVEGLQKLVEELVGHLATFSEKYKEYEENKPRYKTPPQIDPENYDPNDFETSLRYTLKQHEDYPHSPVKLKLELQKLEGRIESLRKPSKLHHVVRETMEKKKGFLESMVPSIELRKEKRETAKPKEQEPASAPDASTAPLTSIIPTIQPAVPAAKVSPTTAPPSGSLKPGPFEKSGPVPIAIHLPSGHSKVVEYSRINILTDVCLCIGYVLNYDPNPANAQGLSELLHIAAKMKFLHDHEIGEFKKAVRDEMDKVDGVETVKHKTVASRWQNSSKRWLRIKDGGASYKVSFIGGSFAEGLMPLYGLTKENILIAAGRLKADKTATPSDSRQTQPTSTQTPQEVQQTQETTTASALPTPQPPKKVDQTKADLLYEVCMCIAYVITFDRHIMHGSNTIPLLLVAKYLGYVEEDEVRLYKLPVYKRMVEAGMKEVTREQVKEAWGTEKVTWLKYSITEKDLRIKLAQHGGKQAMRFMDKHGLTDSKIKKAHALKAEAQNLARQEYQKKVQTAHSSSKS